MAQRCSFWHKATRKKGDQDKANTTYQKIIETWPDTDVATQAQQALDAQSGNTDNSDSKNPTTPKKTVTTMITVTTIIKK